MIEDKIIIKGEGLGKVYKMGEVDVRALRDADFEIYDGEFIVVLGPSGSGKSTLLNIIGGMDNPSTGKIYFEGKDISDLDEKGLMEYRRNVVGFVFQFFNLISSLTVKENVDLAVEIAENSLDTNEILNLVGLTERAGHFPSQLSGGEQQRVSIARAVVKNPKLVLCDEPTGALDFATGLQVLKLLKNLNQDYHKTVVIITHNIAIGKMADRIFTMRDGKIVDIEKNSDPKQPEEINW